MTHVLSEAPLLLPGLTPYATLMPKKTGDGHMMSALMICALKFCKILIKNIRKVRILTLKSKK